MPGRYFEPDSVVVKTSNGKTTTDTIWHKVKNVHFVNQEPFRFKNYMKILTQAGSSTVGLTKPAFFHPCKSVTSVSSVV